MIKLEIDSRIFNIDDEPTKERYNLIVKEVNRAIKEVRNSVYPIFLGPRNLKSALILTLIAIVFSALLESSSMIFAALIGLTIYFIIALILSEVFSHKIKKSLTEQLRMFKEKYRQLAN